MDNYIQPQVQVHQDFLQLPTAVVRNLNAFILGPNYQLMYLDDAAVRSSLNVGTYDPAAGLTTDYPLLASDAQVDVSGVQVVLEQVVARYASLAASASNPMNVVSSQARNKLRAAPEVTEVLEAKIGVGANQKATNGVFLTGGGFYANGAALPENYYFFPQASEGIAQLNAHGVSSPGDAALRYFTSSGLQGVSYVEATDNPLQSGVTIPGPHGLVFDFDSDDGDDNAPVRVAASITYATGTNFTGASLAINGSAPLDVAALIGANHRETINNVVAAVLGADPTDYPNVVDVIHVTGATTGSGVLWIIGNASALTSVAVTGASVAPTVAAVATWNSLIPARVLRFQNAAGTSSFTLTVRESAIGTLLETSLVNGVAPLSAVIDDTDAATTSWDTSLNLLTVAWDAGSAPTLTALHTTLSNLANVDDTFVISAIAGTATDDVAGVVDQFGTPLTTLNAGRAVLVVRDAYKLRVEANEYIFQSGNGYTASPDFKSRGVRVGDRVTYSYLDVDAALVTGSTQVIGFEADRIASQILDSVVNQSATATQDATVLAPHVGADLMVAGSDNQRAFNGADTKLYSLDQAYLGHYPTGVVNDTFVLRVVNGGAPGLARVNIYSTSGYVRNSVQVFASPTGAADEAIVYLGRGLFVLFQKGAADGDMNFQVGDTYTFAQPVAAAWTQVVPAQFLTSGTYVGPHDTTYVLDVVRGGRFAQDVLAAAGVKTVNAATITYTAGTTTGQNIVIGDTTFLTSAFTGGTGTADYAAFVALVNASAEPVWATQVVTGTNAGSVVIRGNADVVQTVALSGPYTGATLAASGAAISADIGLWNAGDVDDEYVLRCTTGGGFGTAIFALESQGGDAAAGIQFVDGVQRTVGTRGLRLTLTAFGSPAFAVGDHYVIRVRACRPQVRITDTAGVDEQQLLTVTTGTELPIGLYGAAVEFLATTDGLLAGDTVYVPVLAESDGAYRTLVLADRLPSSVVPGTVSGTTQLAPTLINVDLHLTQASATVEAARRWSPPDLNWVADADSVALAAGLRIQAVDWVNGDGSRDFIPVTTAQVFIAYRALLLGYADSIYSLNSVGDVTQHLGRIHPDNPLAQGVFHALTNSGPQPVYFMGVPTDDLAGYQVVLQAASLSDEVYGFAPQTTDPVVLSAVKSHILEMSGAEVKRWRIGFFGVQVDAQAPVYTAGTHPDTVDWLGTVEESSIDAGVYNELQIVGAAFLSTTKVGDIVRLRFSQDAWGAPSYMTNTVASILSNEVLVLGTPLTSSVDVAEKVEIWHPRTVPELAQAYADAAASYDNRRIYPVVPGRMRLAGVELGSITGAAAVAGAVSSVVPQAPLTNLEITGFDDVPEVYSTFNKQQLNLIAGSGGFILMQHRRGAKVYVRHQVSSATTQGNLLTRELSITKNFDAVSYNLSAVLEPYYGRFNVTPILLEVMRTEISSQLNYLGSDQVSVGLLGPMLILDNGDTRIVSMAQHPTLKDHVVIVLSLALPVPLNVIVLRLVLGEQSSISIDTTAAV